MIVSSGLFTLYCIQNLSKVIIKLPYITKFTKKSPFLHNYLASGTKYDRTCFEAGNIYFRSEIMSKSALAMTNATVQTKHKSKPRYTEAENRLIFESWWNPQKRRELKGKLGREMNALRSQFCRLLKEKGLSNQEYYSIMQSKHSHEPGTSRKSHELKDIDRIILETFCKHQAQGNSRSQACQELQKKLGAKFTLAALKLRFYRLVKALQYSEEDLLKIGRGIVEKKHGPSRDTSTNSQENDTEEQMVTETVVIPTKTEEKSFFHQISSLPETVQNIETRIRTVEEKQKHQLDLRGFIEHLLAVERDLKREDKLMDEIQRLMNENDNMRGALEKEKERLKKREEELSEVYKVLDTMLGDFMRLESVSKLASLGDFMHRLEITVDQFGNVLRSKRVVV